MLTVALPYLYNFNSAIILGKILANCKFYCTYDLLVSVYLSLFYHFRLLYQCINQNIIIFKNFQYIETTSLKDECVIIYQYKTRTSSIIATLQLSSYNLCLQSMFSLFNQGSLKVVYVASLWRVISESVSRDFGIYCIHTCAINLLALGIEEVGVTND